MRVKVRCKEKKKGSKRKGDKSLRHMGIICHLQFVEKIQGLSRVWRRSIREVP